jgi:hypothetical protein
MVTTERNTAMQRSFSDLEYAARKKVTRRDRFLGEIDAVTPWPPLLAEVEPFYPKGEGRGRSPTGLERLLRMYIAQQCVGLSDEGTEDALYDSQAIRRYQAVEKREENQDRELTWHVALRPGERRALPDSESRRLRERAEQIKASIRAKVEHPFHFVKNVFALRKARYRGQRKNAAQLFTLFGLANLLIAKRRLFALHAQGAS